jgi:hypothetical protein
MVAKFGLLVTVNVSSLELGEPNHHAPHVVVSIAKG